MRKLLFLITVIITTSVFSQENIRTAAEREEMIRIFRDIATNQDQRFNREDFIFGIGINPAISWLDVTHDDLKTDGATITAAIMLNAEYKLSKNFSIASGIVWGIQGGYVSDDASVADLTTKTNFTQNYFTMEMPILAKLSTTPVNKISYYTQVGIVQGYTIASRERHAKSSWEHVNKSITNTHLSNSYTMSWQVGIGTRRAIWGKSAAYAEINFKRSMLNMASEEGYILDGRYTTTPVPHILAGNMFFSFGLNF